MPVSVAPTAPSAPAVPVSAAQPAAPRPGDPACVAFSSTGAFRHAGTSTLEVDLAPARAAAALLAA
ncbi:hypothetical protein [Clavibacter sp. km1a]|uniref:hypothetical protein n=1 Tax=Clavibacter sp. km1a TaxID=3459136 RepID=UPI004041777B